MKVMLTLAKAIEAAINGERVTSASLPNGAVLKLASTVPARKPTLRVVYERSGDGYAFTERDEHDTDDWRIVKGWL